MILDHQIVGEQALIDSTRHLTAQGDAVLHAAFAAVAVGTIAWFHRHEIVEAVRNLIDDFKNRKEKK